MELIEFIVLFIITFLSEIVFAKCFGICVNKKMNLNLFLLFLILIITLLDITNYIFNKNLLFRLAISYLLSVMLHIFIFHGNIKTTIFYTTVIFILGIGCELFLTQILELIKVENIVKLQSTMILEVQFTITNLIFMLLIFKILKRHIKTEKLDLFIQKNDYLNFTAFILFIMFFLLLIVYSFDYSNRYSFGITIISCLTIFMFLGSVIYSYTKESVLVIKNRFLNEKNDYLEKVRDDYRILKHNLINDLLSIEAIGDNNIKALVKEKIKKYNKDYEWISDIEGIPKNVQGLMQLKISEARNLKIDCHIENKIKTDFFSNINMKLYDKIAAAINISLDNAFEGAKECQDKFIFIQIKETNKKLIIEIMNPFINCIDLDKIANKYYSTKKRSRGIGLYSLAKLIKDENKITLKKKIINDIFVSSIIVKK